jgi:protein-S-isoprenylcysteine O-methyltransferase Ste14
MEKNRQELIDNYKAEQRAIKVRKVLTKTKEWGENIAAVLFFLVMAGTIIVICVGVWNMGLGFLLIGAGVALALVVIWHLVDSWSDTELDKARQRRYNEMRGED